MKAYMMVIGTLLAATAVAGTPAQKPGDDDSKVISSSNCRYTHAYIERAVKNYAGCLESSNLGVVESALAEVAKMKLILPDVNSGNLVNRIESLMDNSQAPSIRYKAYLTLMVFDSPNMFTEEARTEFKDYDELFSALASRLQHSHLGYNN